MKNLVIFGNHSDSVSYDICHSLNVGGTKDNLTCIFNIASIRITAMLILEVHAFKNLNNEYCFPN
jgi:hypothetical protein